MQNEQYQDESPALKAEAFEELLDTYHEAGKKRLTGYFLLKVVSVESYIENAELVMFDNLRTTDYIGYRKDGNLYILLTSTDKAGCVIVQKNLEQKGIRTMISEEIGL